MKIVIEPNKLQQLLKQVFMSMSKSSPLISEVIIICKPDEPNKKGKLIIADQSLGFAGLYAQYAKDFFLQYECEKQETILITKTIFDTIMDSKTFIGDKQITISTLDNHIYFRGERETYGEPLQEAKVSPFFKGAKPSEFGIIPEKYVPTMAFSTVPKEFDVPETEYFTLQSDGTSIKVCTKDIGTYEKTLKISETLKPKLTQHQITLDQDYLDHQLANISGEAIFSSDGIMFVTYQQTKDYMITYYLKGKEETEQEKASKPKQQEPPEPLQEDEL